MLPFVAWLITRILYATLRVRHVNVENIERTPQYVVAFWHCHLLLMLHCRWRPPMTTLISRSKDGEIVARVFRYYDVVARRGSSSRGGDAAVREIIRDARNGMNVGVTPDGPRGPGRIAKEGVIYIAKLTELPIVPVAFAARNRKLLRSWDRMIVPLPFSKALFLYGEPIRVPRDGDTEEWRGRVERTLNELAEEAERLVNQ